MQQMAPTPSVRPSPFPSLSSVKPRASCRTRCKSQGVRDGGRTKVVWRHFCHARSPSASVLGPTLSPSTPQPIPVALQCPNAMPIPIFARTRHFACSPMH